MMHFLGVHLARALIVVLNYTAPFGLTVQRDLPYAQGAFHQLDVYSLDRSVDRPVIVYLYGGGWRGGSKGRAAYVGGVLARRGFVVVIPEYRHVPQATLPDILADHAAAVGWALAHAGEIGGDPRRVIVMGSSSGAWGAAMLALDPRWLAQAGAKPGDLAGMVGLAGPYLIASLTEQPDRDVFRGTGPEMEPVHHAAGPHPPILLMTGTSDTDVLPIGTATLAKRLRETPGAIETRHYVGLGHEDIVQALVFPFNRHVSVADDIEIFAKSLRVGGPHSALP